ncbi:hypothetical protein [Dorea sp. D27]|uniref:hypothetical protein n=1 Tax=Dorea sp. D27 TaxID=658665 RepID=UPI000673A29E|nr:hypothetical protein [Dorea sp. D27]KMZ53988.1 hypothetical protein HMPREF0980_01831 [Dorea sp. D27]
MQALYPNGGFKVFSDIHMRENPKAEDHLAGEEAEVGLYPYQNRLAWTKRVVGYIPVVDGKGEEGFLRIVDHAWHRLLSVILAALVCAIIFLAGIWIARKDEVEGLDKTAVSYHVEGIKNTDSDSILLPGVSTLNGREGDTHIKAVLLNPEGNECYFRYTIKQTDTGESLYASGLIEPGKAVMEFDLNKKLESGTYPIEVIVETRDIQEPKIVYNAGNIQAQLVITE